MGRTPLALSAVFASCSSNFVRRYFEGWLLNFEPRYTTKGHYPYWLSLTPSRVSKICRREILCHNSFPVNLTSPLERKRRGPCARDTDRERDSLCCALPGMSLEFSRCSRRFVGWPARPFDALLCVVSVLSCASGSVKSPDMDLRASLMASLFRYARSPLRRLPCFVPSSDVSVGLPVSLLESWRFGNTVVSRWCEELRV